jgi:hypothetical protein
MVSIIIPISAITIKIVSMIPARWPGVLNTTVWFLHVGQVYSIQQYDSCTLARCTQYNSMITAGWPGVLNATVWFLHIGQVYSIQQYDSGTLARCTQYNSIAVRQCVFLQELSLPPPIKLTANISPKHGRKWCLKSIYKPTYTHVVTVID